MSNEPSSTNPDSEPPADWKPGQDSAGEQTGTAVATQDTSAYDQQLVQPSAYDQQLVEIDKAMTDCSAMLAAGNFSESFALVRAMRRIDQLITPDMMQDVMWLMNTELGFLTDRDPSKAKANEKVDPYPETLVKRCVIAAGLKGARFTGNEMNILASRTYLTKEFFIRKVREFSGLTDLKETYGYPTTRDGVTVVDATATWKLNGVPDKLERTGKDAIPIIVSSYSSHDQNLGKAGRKLMAAVYRQLTGSKQGEYDEADDPDLANVDQTLLEDARKQNVDDVQRHPENDYQQAPRGNGPGSEVDPWAVLEAQYMDCHTQKQAAAVTARFKQECADLVASNPGRAKTAHDVHQKRLRGKK